jgi:hypothetical protein
MDRCNVWVFLAIAFSVASAVPLAGQETFPQPAPGTPLRGAAVRVTPARGAAVRVTPAPGTPVRGTPVRVTPAPGTPVRVTPIPITPPTITPTPSPPWVIILGALAVIGVVALLRWLFPPLPTFHPHWDPGTPQTKRQENVTINYELHFEPNLSKGQQWLETGGASPIILRKNKQ